jgi:hypothetical protein
MLTSPLRNTAIDIDGIDGIQFTSTDGFGHSILLFEAY